ncbi:MAG: hypothetical protein AAGF97_05650, partial [Planctomycetota bacterium]
MNDAVQPPQEDVATWSRRLPSPVQRIWRLCIKELRETLRDRRTMVTLILMPLIVYPLLSIIFQRFLLDTFQTTTNTKCIVGVEQERDGQMFAALVRAAKEQFQQDEEPTPVAAEEQPLNVAAGIPRDWRDH